MRELNVSEYLVKCRFLSRNRYSSHIKFKEGGFGGLVLLFDDLKFSFEDKKRRYSFNYRRTDEMSWVLNRGPNAESEAPDFLQVGFSGNVLFVNAERRGGDHVTVEMDIGKSCTRPQVFGVLSGTRVQIGEEKWCVERLFGIGIKIEGAAFERADIAIGILLIGFADFIYHV
jgi:hypothetical protein